MAGRYDVLQKSYFNSESPSVRALLKELTDKVWKYRDTNPGYPQSRILGIITVLSFKQINPKAPMVIEAINEAITLAEDSTA